MADENVFDNMLFGILNHGGSYEKFLDAIFSFLSRRTYFFKYIKDGDCEKPGLPRGLAEEMLKTIYKKYVKLEDEKQNNSSSEHVYVQECREEVVVTMEMEPEHIGKEDATYMGEIVKTTEVKPEHVGKEDATYMGEIVKTRKVKPEHVGKEDATYMGEIVKTTEVEPEHVGKEDVSYMGEIVKTTEVEPEHVDKEDATYMGEIVKMAKVKPEYAVATSYKENDNVLDDHVLKQDETLSSQQVSLDNTDKTNINSERTYYDSNPECYNGAAYDKYCWSQTINDLDVMIKVPGYIRNGKQVKVNIAHTHMKAEVLMKDNEWEDLLDGELCWKIDTEGSTWTLDPGHHVHIHLEKHQERFWDALLEDEPKIDVQAIDCSKPYEDLCEEEQAKIQEVIYDQQQKRLGKPTVQETKVHEILKEAWNKKDSPFKGKEFDPSHFNVV